VPPKPLNTRVEPGRGEPAGDQEEETVSEPPRPVHVKRCGHRPMDPEGHVREELTKAKHMPDAVMQPPEQEEGHWEADRIAGGEGMGKYSDWQPAPLTTPVGSSDTPIRRSELQDSWMEPALVRLLGVREVMLPSSSNAGSSKVACCCRTNRPEAVTLTGEDTDTEADVYTVTTPTMTKSIPIMPPLRLRLPPAPTSS